MEDYKVTFSPSGHKVIKTTLQSKTLRDEIIFRLLFDISQAALPVHTKAIGICVTDSLRKLFMDFLSNEMQAYDILVKLGKAKGWVNHPPVYKPAE